MRYIIRDLEIGVIKKSTVPFAECIAEGADVVRRFGGEGAVHSLGGDTSSAGDVVDLAQFEDFAEDIFVFGCGPAGFAVLVEQYH